MVGLGARERVRGGETRRLGEGDLDRLSCSGAVGVWRSLAVIVRH